MIAKYPHFYPVRQVMGCSVRQVMEFNAWSKSYLSLLWRHNEHDGVSNHRGPGGLLNHLFRHRSKKTSKLRVTGLCERNSSVTGEFLSQRASNAENVSIWWRYHGTYAIADRAVYNIVIYLNSIYHEWNVYTKDTLITPSQNFTEAYLVISQCWWLIWLCSFRIY